MTKKLLLSNCLLAISIVALSGFTPAQSVRETGNLITVLNPSITEKLAPRIPLAARTGDLEGKTIYLIDTNYEGMGRTPVLEEMQAWFVKNMPKVNVIFKLKRGNYAEDDAALWKEIADKKGSGVIIGVAG
jgi:hypothetical protein